MLANKNRLAALQKVGLCFHFLKFIVDQESIGDSENEILLLPVLSTWQCVLSISVRTNYSRQKAQQSKSACLKVKTARRFFWEHYQS